MSESSTSSLSTTSTYIDSTTIVPSITAQRCVRCGKPALGSYLNNEPVCAWCLAELEKRDPARTIGLEPSYDVNYYHVIPGSEQLFVKVKYMVDGIEPLEYIGGGKSDWVDLRVAEDIRIWKGEFHLLPLGVAIELPKGYEALVAPRSSTFKNYGLLQANSLGVIDEAFCGDDDHWHLPVYATKTVRLHKNDRIAQFRIIKHQPKLIFQTVDQLDGENRCGFGSTGTN